MGWATHAMHVDDLHRGFPQARCVIVSGLEQRWTRIHIPLVTVR